MPEPTAIELTEFEQVEAAPGTALLRVAARPTNEIRSDQRPTLVADDGRRVHRLAPLPALPDPSGLLRAAFSVPASLLGVQSSFSLELSNPGGHRPSGADAPHPALRRRAPGSGAAERRAAR
jgi:hypothetical protein